MANLTIAQLTQILAAGVDNADLLPLWDDTAQETKKITIAQFKTLIGAVESVGATSPIASSGGKTPTISISQSGAATDGYLSSTDWNNFNGKQGAITLTTTGSSGAATFIGNTLNIPNYTASGIGAVTSVGATSPIASSGGQTPTISMPQSNASTNGWLSSADWNTFNGKQGAITLTTTGSSGAATFIGNTLNIPNYSFSLVNWSETFSSATQATSQWTPLNAATNVNAAITPKGTGALVAQIPTGTTVGGNSRGAYAVDFQMVRASANQVAGGLHNILVGGAENNTGTQNFSIIVGGYQNSNSGELTFCGNGIANIVSGRLSAVLNGQANNISGVTSVIAGGGNSTITQQNGFIGGGGSNTISAQYGTIGGGQTNTVSGVHGSIVGGLQNTASGQYSIVAGGYANSATATQSSVLGGVSNIASGSSTVAVGGQENQAQAIYDTVVGGLRNVAGNSGTGNEGYKFIGGGANNNINIFQNEYSVLVGGTANTIYGFSGNSFIGGGNTNRICGFYSTLIGGATNRIGNGAVSTGNRATYCFLGGGQTNVVDTNSDYSSIVGGLSNQISGVDYAFIGGGYQGVATLQAQQVYSGGAFTTAGDAQAHELIWRRLVTGTAQTELFLDGASIAAILPATNALWQGTIEIAAICSVVGNGTTTLGDAQGTSYKVTIKRLGATTALVGTVQEIGTTNADPSALGVFTIDANDTNESLRIQFTPPPSAGSTTVHRVVATFRGLQIQY